MKLARLGFYFSGWLVIAVTWYVKIMVVMHEVLQIVILTPRKLGLEMHVNFIFFKLGIYFEKLSLL